MKPGAVRTTRVPDVALLAPLLLLLVPAVQPLLRAELTCGYDNVFHLWRAVQVKHLWSQGILYARWAPDMAHGFGFPLFVFVPPGAAFVAAFWRGVGLAWPVALNATFALGMVLGAVGMFFLGRELFGPWAGLVAGVAYAYAPFQAYDVFNRGSLSESFAWAFPPLVLWGVHRWAMHRDRRFLLLGALSLAGVTLCHQVFAFLFAPLLAAWVLLMGVQAPDGRRAVGRGVLLGALGMGCAAFFWLPPMFERAWVQTERLLGTWVFDVHHNFLPLAHLLAPPRAADPRLINDWPEKALGLVPVLLALLPLARWRRLTRAARGQVGLLWALAVGYAFVTLAPSRWLWDHVPLLPYIQFPWRYLGPGAFCLALLAGAGVSGLRASRAAWGAGAVALVLVCANLGWFFPRHCSAPSDTSPAAMIAWERATDTLGMTAKGEYLPVWVRAFPEGELLDAAYRAGGPIARLAGVPAGATVVQADYGALGATITLETPTAFQARYRAFYYPGWKAKVDGAPVAVTPTSGSGFVSFPVPAGRHTLEVGFGETPLRWAADGIALLCLGALVGVALATPPARERGAPRWEIRPQEVLGGGIIALGLVLLKLMVIDESAILWRRTRLRPDGTLIGITQPLKANFGGRAELLGVDPLPAAFPGDAVPTITLYWRALRPEAGDWHVGLTFVAEDGTRWQPAGLRPVRWGREPPPMSAWPPDGYARMDDLVDLAPGMPPGVYTVQLSLFDRATLAPASVLGPDGNPQGPALALGPVRVDPPRRPPTPAALDVPPDADVRACGALGLWSMTADRAQAAPGDLVTVRWVWEALATPTAPLTAALSLRDASGDVVRAWSRPPSASWWPAERWTAGERWVGRPSVRLPGALESGTYTLSTRLPGCDALASVPLRVEAPERRWSVPAALTTTEVVLGGRAALVGYAVEPRTARPGERVTVRLAWQARAEMVTAYHVFVHVLDPATGRVLAQSDGEPAGWTRPTTGWAVGEVVVDARELSVPTDAPAGSYALRVGLYLPEAGRLPISEGSSQGEDAIPLGILRVR